MQEIAPKYPIYAGQKASLFLGLFSAAEKA